jgi:hypothetical protein
MQKIINFHAEMTVKGLPTTQNGFDGVIVCSGFTPADAYHKCIKDLCQYVGDIEPIAEMLDLDSIKFHNDLDCDRFLADLGNENVSYYSVAMHYKYAE